MKGLVLIVVLILLLVFGGYVIKRLDAALETVERERDEHRD